MTGSSSPCQCQPKDKTFLGTALKTSAERAPVFYELETSLFIPLWDCYYHKYHSMWPNLKINLSKDFFNFPHHSGQHKTQEHYKTTLFPLRNFNMKAWFRLFKILSSKQHNLSVHPVGVFMYLSIWESTDVKDQKKNNPLNELTNKQFHSG